MRFACVSTRLTRRAKLAGRGLARMTASLANRLPRARMMSMSHRSQTLPRIVTARHIKRRVRQGNLLSRCRRLVRTAYVTIFAHAWLVVIRRSVRLTFRIANVTTAKAGDFKTSRTKRRASCARQAHSATSSTMRRCRRLLHVLLALERASRGSLVK